MLSCWQAVSRFKQREGGREHLDIVQSLNAVCFSDSNLWCQPHSLCMYMCVCVFRWSWLFSTWLSLTLISSVKLLDGCIAVNPLASIINLGLTVSRPVEFAAVGSTHLRYKMCAAHVCTGPLSVSSYNI